jgi:hypothetical protein
MEKQNELDTLFTQLKKEIKYDTHAKEKSLLEVKQFTNQRVKHKNSKVPAYISIAAVAIAACLFLLFKNPSNEQTTSPTPVLPASSDTVFDVATFGKSDATIKTHLLENLVNFELIDNTSVTWLDDVRVNEEGTAIVIFNDTIIKDLNNTMSTYSGGFLMRVLNATMFSYDNIDTVYYTVNGNATTWTKWFEAVDEPFTRDYVYPFLSDKSYGFTENDFVNFKGFSGKYFASYYSNEIRILNNSLNTFNEAGSWASYGLIRNEADVIGSAIVHATLKDANGNVLEKIQTNVLVDEIRFGEPAPFVIKSTTPIEAVFSTEWEITIEPPTFKNRDFLIFENWELHYGEEMYNHHTKRNDPPYPYVLSFSSENLSAESPDVKIVVAWTDENGKVMWIEEAPLSEEFNNGLPNGGIGNFEDITVTNEAIAPLLPELTRLVWVLGL